MGIWSLKPPQINKYPYGGRNKEKLRLVLDCRKSGIEPTTFAFQAKRLKTTWLQHLYNENAKEAVHTGRDSVR